MAKLNAYSITPIAKGLLLLFGLGLLPKMTIAQDQGAEQTSGSVRGHITDPNGQAVIGAAIQVKGTSKGTVTDLDGNFSISAGNGATLVVSYVGFLAKEVPVTGSNMNVILAKKANDLNEVIVIGYGSVQRKDLTGSIATVTSKDFQQGQITTPEQLISGKVSGVVVTSNGGSPGSGSQIRIRGGASLNASNNALIVVDGIPFSDVIDGGIAGAASPLSLINPADIETFTVLKDAAATAIYGSRASNGVILITTRQGRPGKLTVSFNTQATLSKIIKPVDVLSADQFRAYVDSNGTAAQIGLLGTANTDWQKQIYQTAFTSQNTLSVSGGTKALPFRVSVGYLNQQGILKTDQLQRTTANINLRPSFFKNDLKLDINVNGAADKTRFANQGAIGAAVSFDPTKPVYQAGSSFGGFYEWTTGTAHNALATDNPVALLQQRQDVGYATRSFGNINADYKIHFFPDLHAHVNAAYDVSQGDGTVYVPGYAAQNYADTGLMSHYLQHTTNTTLEAFLNYIKSVPSIKSSFNVTAGYGFYGFNVTNYNYASQRANGTVEANTIPTYAVDSAFHSILSYYGRLIYTLDDKYIITANYRADKGSRFGGKTGYFPGIAGTWRVNREGALKDSKTLTDLKLRGSYGKTGQQDLPPQYNYLYLPFYSLSGGGTQYQFGNTFYNLYAPLAYNTQITWETTAAYDAGLDFGFLNNRLSGTLDFYDRRTTNLLNVVPVPAGSNFTNQILYNIGKISSHGIEFAINAIPVNTKNFSWSVSYNVSYTKATVTKLAFGNNDSASSEPVGGVSGATGTTIQTQAIGNNPYSFLVYQQVYGTNGKPIEGAYVDRNGDGIINDKDRYIYKSAIPPVTMGFSTTFTYKSWSLSTTLRANIGNYLYDNTSSNLAVTRQVANPSGYLQNTPVDILNTRFYNNQFQSDYYIKNASFLKMDYINLGYSTGRLSNYISNMRLSVGVQNVFTITKYKGLDPENPTGIDNNFYPRPRIYSVGLGLDF